LTTLLPGSSKTFRNICNTISDYTATNQSALNFIAVAVITLNFTDFSIS
jgi:hypothetical protein